MLHSSVSSVIYTFDRTLDGLLSAVFDAYFRRQQPEMLVGEGDQLPLFCEEVYQVTTTDEKARRVWAGLEKRLKSEALKLIAVSWMSEEKDLPTPLFRYIYKVFQSKGGGGYDFTDADVLHVTNTARRVMHEQLRMKQFVRFQKAKDGRTALISAWCRPTTTCCPSSSTTSRIASATSRGSFMMRKDITAIIILRASHPFASPSRMKRKCRSTLQMENSTMMC